MRIIEPSDTAISYLVMYALLAYPLAQLRLYIILPQYLPVNIL